MLINRERLVQHFEELSLIGKIKETGVCRPTLSEIEKEAFKLAERWMKEAGMTVRLDDFGNLIGRLEGQDPAAPVLMVGSHLDSQPYGGRFDGPAGVLGAIEAVATLHEKGIVPERPIEVVAFCDEEGWRFGKGLFGSRGISGQVEQDELQREDKEGISRSEALTRFGCDPTKLEASVYPPGAIYAYLEMHIEQGPILDKANAPLGLVTGISGPLWLTVKIKGEAGHAGSVPMAMRHDALLGAAEIMVAFNTIVKQHTETPIVGTVGDLKVFPNSRNIIPEEVTFTIDLRSIDLDLRNKCEKQLEAAIQDISQKHGLTYEITEDFKSEPRYCADWIKETIRTEAGEMGLTLPELMSGPFHDALALSNVCDYGMIFVRCKDGISHHPAEYSSYEDLALGTDLLCRTILKVSQSLI
jgi:hydantoinase/carbamoylase family amidase